MQIGSIQLGLAVLGLAAAISNALSVGKPRTDDVGSRQPGRISADVAGKLWAEHERRNPDYRNTLTEFIKSHEPGTVISKYDMILYYIFQQNYIIVLCISTKQHIICFILISIYFKVLRKIIIIN